jgi:hypothetical protein
MPTNYVLRLYSADPRSPAITDGGGIGAPSFVDGWGPSRYLSGWVYPTQMTVGASLSEQLVSMSDPDGQNRNVASLSFLCGEPGCADPLVRYVGICLASALGAPLTSAAKGAIPLATIAWPGGTKVVPNGGRLTAAPGALVFTLPS